MPLDNKSELSVDKAKILIVDTDSMSSELLQFRFESEGFQAVIISSGEKALESDLSGYSLIIVDLMDQELNGVKFPRNRRKTMLWKAWMPEPTIIYRNRFHRAN